LDNIFNPLREANIHIIESKKKGFLYPANREEFIAVKEENFPLISEHLGSETILDEGEINHTLLGYIRMDIEDKFIALRLDL
jgi:hypothetical protein